LRIGKKEKTEAIGKKTAGGWKKIEIDE